MRGSERKLGAFEDLTLESEAQASSTIRAGGWNLCRSQRALDRLLQHLQVADVIGQQENETRVQGSAVRFVQAAMRLDQEPEGGVGIGKAAGCIERGHQ
jgi:hypothetical protein